MLKKLRNKLLIVNLISLTLVIAIAFSVIYISAYNRYQRETDAQLGDIPPSVLENAFLADQQPSPADPENENGENGGNNDDLMISGSMNLPVDYTKSFVLNLERDGSLSVFSQLELERDDYIKAAETAFNGDAGTGGIELAGHKWKYRVSGPGNMLGENYASAVVFLDVSDDQRSLRAILVSLIVIGLAAIGVILFVSLLTANRAIVPIEESIRKQRQFVADASHELKTPLAIIGANTEAARGAPDPEWWLTCIEEESERMNKLIESLLYLAKAQDTQMEHLPFDLAKAVTEETSRIDAVLFEKGVAMELFGTETELLVKSDKERLMQALLVLLDNAVKYTKRGGTVTVRVSSLRNNAQVAVENSGAFIEHSDLARVFDRFYRADKSRNSGTGGHGLGLAIAKEVMEQLGGDIKAESKRSADGGARNTFTITVPM